MAPGRSILDSIGDFIRSRSCEKVVKYTANDIEISGIGTDAGSFKFNVASYKKKVKEVVPASEAASALDDAQYQLCRIAAEADDSKTKDAAIRIRMLVIVDITRLRTLLASIVESPTKELKRELREWTRHTNRFYEEIMSWLVKTTVGAEGPTKVPRRFTKEKAPEVWKKYQRQPVKILAVARPPSAAIMNYLKIEQNELSEAVARIE